MALVALVPQVQTESEDHQAFLILLHQLMEDMGPAVIQKMVKQADLAAVQAPVPAQL